jgi:hypothetical protein
MVLEGRIAANGAPTCLPHPLAEGRIARDDRESVRDRSGVPPRDGDARILGQASATGGDEGDPERLCGGQRDGRNGVGHGGIDHDVRCKGLLDQAVRSVGAEETDVILEVELVTGKRHRGEVIPVADDPILAADAHIEEQPDGLHGMLVPLLPDQRPGTEDAEKTSAVVVRSRRRVHP